MIVRPDNLGDLVIFSGTLRHFRNYYPDAHITICVKKYAKNLLKHCPYIDEIIIWEEIQKTFLDRFPEFKGRWRLANMIKRFRIARLTFLTSGYDLLLSPIRSPILEMHQFSKYVNSKIKVSVFDEARQHPISKQEFQHIYTDVYKVSETREFEHELSVHHDFLNYLGIDVSKEDLIPEIFTTEDDRDWAKAHVDKSDGTTVLAVCPGVTSRPEKYYAAENYREALSNLKGHTFSICILGSKAEMEQCSQVEDALKDCKQVVSIKNLAGKTTIRQLTECIRLADITLSNETGALHIATALNKPTIGIMGGGHFGRFYPWGDPEINLTANLPMDCYYCNWVCKYPTMKCIHDMEPEVISNKLLQLLDTLKTE